jgi:hypothetical protein
VKGKIAEELYRTSAAFEAREEQAVEVAARLGIPADAVRFSAEVTGQAPSRTSAGGMAELTDGVFYAEKNGKLYVLGILESKSPSNQPELAHKISGGKAEWLGQPGLDFERLRELPVAIDGRTFDPENVRVSRTFTRMIGVLAKDKSLSGQSVRAIRDQVVNFETDNVDVNDQVLNDLARLIIDAN